MTATAQAVRAKPAAAAPRPALATPQASAYAAPRYLQARLALGAPHAPEEREADHAADRVMRSADCGCCPTCNGSASSPIVRRSPEHASFADQELPPGSERRLLTLMQGGEPLSRPLRDFYEPRLGSDLTAVRVHRDAEAGEVARSIGARAFAVGDHIAVAPHHWSPDTWQGRRLLAHELAHVQQRNAETLRRDDEAPPAPEDTVDWVAALRIRLEDERNEAALDVIGAMNRTQADQVLADPVIRALAVKAFDKDEMGSAVLSLGGAAIPSLQLLFADDCGWDQIAPYLRSGPPGLDAVLPDNAMMAGFVDALGDEEMAAALLLLPGTLIRKIEWLREEDVGYDEAMTVIKAAPAVERSSLYTRDDVRDWFVKICDDEQMKNIVLLLGGTPRQQMRWLLAEDTNWKLLLEVVHNAPKGAWAELLDDPDMEKLLKDNIGKRNLKLVLDVIGGPLSRQMELMEDRGVSDAPENATTAPSLDERDVRFLNQLEGRTALLQRYEEFEKLVKNTRSLAAVAGARDESVFAPKEAFAAQNALIAELTAQGFFGPPNLQLAGFQREISRFESLFLGFGLQTAFAMLTDNERIAKQERERYWGAEAATLLRIIAAKLDKFDKVAIATTWTGVVPGSLRSEIGNYPILAHPDFYTPDMSKMVENGDRIGLTMHTRSVANDVLQNVEEARNGLRDDTDKLWQLDGVITQAKQLLGITEGSIFDRLIKRKLERIHANELFRSIVLGALAIGLGLLTGGTGALAVTAAAGLAAISVAGAVQSWQRYSFTSAAHGSAIDPARALAQVEPSGLWLAIDVIGAFLDLGAFVKAINALHKPAEALMLSGEAAQTTEQALRNETHDVVKSNNLRGGRDIVSEEAFVASVMDSAERHASQKAILAGDAKLSGEVRSTLVGNRLEGLARDDAMVSGLVALGEDTARAALRSFGHEPELLGRLALLAESEPVMAQGIAKLRGSLGDAAFENIMRDALIRRDPGRVSVLVAAAGADRLTAEQLAGLKRVAEDANAANRSRAIAGELEHTLPQATGLHAPGSQAELAALESTRSLETGSKDISAARLADEMAYVEHSRPLPINQGEYVAEVVLPNGHVWRRNRNGNWCRFSNGGWCMAKEGLTHISGRVTRAERELETIAPLDWPVYRIDPQHPPDIVPPGVVLETPTGERYFRTSGEEGGTVMESVLGPSARRRHYERRYNRRGEMGGDYTLSTMELAHPQGAGTHAEALFGISPAPRDMNQTLQNLCAEEFLRELQRVRRPASGELLLEGIEFHQITVAKKWPLSPNLREIEYRIDLSSAAGRRRGFEISLHTSDNTVNARALIGKTGYVSREIAPLIDEVQLAYRMRERLEAILERARAARAVRAAQRRRRVP